LPQSPAVQRASSDAADKGLKGKVKTVTSENALVSANGTARDRKIVSSDSFDESGNFIKRITYDFRGHPDQITVYGFLDGNRVSSSKPIEYEYNPPPMAISTESKPKSPKTDPRFSMRLKYDYDAGGRLASNSWYDNDGTLRIRYAYSYKDGRKDELVYDGAGKVIRKYAYTVDEKGVETRREAFDLKDSKVTETLTYKYEFDVQGNWIKRTATKSIVKDGRTEQTEYAVDYRTISYF